MNKGKSQSLITKGEIASPLSLDTNINVVSEQRD
jgi:hypothetical protein